MSAISAPAARRATGPTPAIARSPTVPVVQRACACGGRCAGCRARAAATSDEAPYLQTKLTVGPPGDTYEREADRVADQVMRMPEPALQRQEEDDEEELRMTPLGPSSHGQHRPAGVGDVLAAPGRPLDLGTRRFMEQRFGRPFDHVRVYTGGRASEAARAVHARAFTVGRNVVFNAGEFAPSTVVGRRLLAHELTHVVQQTGAVADHAPAPDPETLQRKPDGSAAPGATVKGCADPGVVLRELTRAGEDAAVAVSYLDGLGSLPRKDRRHVWNDGLEHAWFGDYTGHRFRVVRWRLRRIRDKLRHPRLTVVCNAAINTWGNAHPAINTIELRGKWIASSDKTERRQTFIHEAGHIVGVWNTHKQEARFYGRGPSQALAAASPLMALRNADNFGYYVVDRAALPVVPPVVEEEPEAFEVGPTLAALQRKAEPDAAAPAPAASPTRRGSGSPAAAPTPACASTAGPQAHTFQSPPTLVEENPVDRLNAGKTAAGETFLEVQGTIVNPQNTMTMGQLVDEYRKLLKPSAAVATPGAGGAVTCCFPDAFTIAPSARAIVTTPPGAGAWTANVTPNNFLSSPDQPTCAGKTGVPVTLRGKPTDADYARTVKAAELEHVAALQELHQRHFVPYYKFVAGLTASAPDAAACDADLRRQIGKRDVQAATGFVLGDVAETRRLDDPTQGTHIATLTPAIDAGCASIIITATPRTRVAGTSRGNVRTIAPVSTAIDATRLSVDGSDLKDGATVVASFSSPAGAARALAVFQHYGIDEKRSIGTFDYFLAGGAPPSGALAGSADRTLAPALYQVSVDVTPAGGWVIVEAVGDQVSLIHEFGADRDEAYSAVEQMRAHGFNREVWIPSAANADLRYFRRD